MVETSVAGTECTSWADMVPARARDRRAMVGGVL